MSLEHRRSLTPSLNPMPLERQEGRLDLQVNFKKRIDSVYNRVVEEKIQVEELLHNLSARKGLFESSVAFNGRSWHEAQVRNLKAVDSLLEEALWEAGRLKDSISAADDGTEGQEFPVAYSKPFDSSEEFILNSQNQVLGIANEIIALRGELLKHVSASKAEAVKFVGENGRLHGRQLKDLKKLDEILERNYRLAYLNDREFSIAYLALHSKLPHAMERLEAAKKDFEKCLSIEGKARDGFLDSLKRIVKHRVLKKWRR